MAATTPGPLRPRASRGRRGGSAARSFAATATLLLALVAAGCGASGDPDLHIGDARASERLGGASQVVVEVDNRGDGDDRLIDATTPAAIGTEIHLTTIDGDGRATMDTIDGADIPAGEVTRFRPGGLHLMLTVPDESVVLGGTFELTLEFEVSGEVTVPVTVVDRDELLDGVPAPDDLDDPGDTDPTDP